jgi:CCR4-NOT transcription complex subunit 6
VFCYNILAESYANADKMNWCPSWALAWSYRKSRILKEIIAHEPDIVCLQEVEAEQLEVYFQPELSSRGYQCRFQPKSRARTMDEIAKKTVDGCVTFWKRELFSLVAEEVIEFHGTAMTRHDNIGQAGINRLLSKDNIALCVLLKPKNPLLTISPHAGENDHLFVVNTHIHWDPRDSDVKLMQVQMLIECLEDRVESYRKKQGIPLPMLLCGDLNSSPDSAVYNLLSGKHVEGNHEDFSQQDYGNYTKKGLSTSLSLKSAYASVASEPPFTNFGGDFVGVLDYIWFTDDLLSAEKVLAGVSEETVRSYNGALPNPFMCSDHIPIAAELNGRLPR